MALINGPKFGTLQPAEKEWRVSETKRVGDLKIGPAHGGDA